MSYVAELSTVKQLFTTWWGSDKPPLLWPNDPQEPPVDPVGSKDSPLFPAAFVAIDVEYDSQELVTSTTTEIRGRVVCSVWVELTAEEEALRGHIEALKTMFRDHGDAGGLQFLAPLVSDKAFPDDESSWYGRAVAFPFVRFEEV